MTRRRFNRLCLGLLLATAAAFLALIGMLVAGVDPDAGEIMAAQYALLLIGNTTLLVSVIGNRMVPRHDEGPR